MGTTTTTTTATADAAVDEIDSGTFQLDHTLFVAREGSLVSFDIATGEERPGTVTDVAGPVDLTALDDGAIVVNLTGRDEVLFVDGTTMLEEARVASSETGGTRPVHGFISPTYSGTQYWMALNDGAGMAAENKASFFDITSGSATRFEYAGEVELGLGHHKAAFSHSMPRVAISNISDCDNVVTVYDLSNLGDIESLATFTGAHAGFDAAEPDGFDPAYCDPTYSKGLPPSPHGIQTASGSGKSYNSVTSNGEMTVIDIDAETPTFMRLATTGSGGGFTDVHPAGRYVYTMQESPREGDGGLTCQIGQMVVTDSSSDTVVAEVPLKYTGPECDTAIADTAAETANLGHFYMSGDYLYAPTGGGFRVEDARVDQVVVVDISAPAAPVQTDSISVGVTTGHGSGAVSGDGKLLFVVNNIDGTVSQIDTETRSVTATLDVGDNPKVLATYGSAEGPSHQTGVVQ